MNFPSLSSSHPILGNLQNHHRLYDACDEKGGGASAPSPSPRRSTRNTKRHVDSTSKSQRAAQLAKQELCTKLREDWAWPPAPDGSSQLAPNVPDDESAWQERRDGYDTDSSLGGTIAMDPYQFEDPDSVKAPANTASSSDSKKRRRCQILLEEMRWNEGLRLFVERRDAWSGARAFRHDPLCTGSGNPGSASRCSHHDSEKIPFYREDATYDPSDAINSVKIESKAWTNVSPSSPEQQPLDVTFVPLAPPLLPSDIAVRAGITPATYPSIYSKIVIQGLTPTVPINLNDVVGALVKGWKDNDEWPPKSDIERTLPREVSKGFEGVGASVNSGVKDGVRRRVGKVKRVLHLAGTGEVDQNKQVELEKNEKSDD